MYSGKKILTADVEWMEPDADGTLMCNADMSIMHRVDLHNLSDWVFIDANTGIPYHFVAIQLASIMQLLILKLNRAVEFERKSKIKTIL